MRKIWEYASGLKLNTKFTMLIVIAFIIPIAFLAGVLYYNMERNVIDENVSNLSYIMDRNEQQIHTNLDAVNMSTQFTLSDVGILEVLNTAAEGKKYSTSELIRIYDEDVSMLERLVNNNPLLYNVRVYASNDNLQEMMPVIYKYSRMQKLDWANKGNIYGWHFGYADTLFSTLESEDNSQLLSLVTEIKDFKNGTIGTIEVAMKMSTMFPSIYETDEESWSGFWTDNHVYYTKDRESWIDDEFLNRIQSAMTASLEEGAIKDTYFEKNGKNSYVVSYLYVKELGGTLIVVRDITEDVNAIYNSRLIFVLVTICIIILLSVVVRFIVTRMLRQFYEILKTMKAVQDGDLNARIAHCTGDEVGLLGNRLKHMLDEIQILMQDGINREVLMKNTEIRALQNQINAHFIYNSLESIKMMAEIDEEYDISDSITALGKLLRYSMRWVSGNVMVNEEMDYIYNYITLMNLRFDYKIILSVNMPDEILCQKIPKMSLQPIVENAIVHGIEEVAEDTTIYLKGYIKDKDCYIEISDSGKGMTEEEVIRLKKKIAGQIEDGGGSGHGIGLKNVQDRINIAFGSEYGIDIASQINCYTKIIVHLPFVTDLMV